MTATRYKELAPGAFFAVLGLYILVKASQWEFLGEDGPGPGFFPVVYGVIMLGAALALCGKTLLAATRERAAAQLVEPTDRGGTIAALLTLVVLAVDVWLISVLGFVIGFGLAVFVLVKFVFNQSYLKAAITAAAIAVGIHVVFQSLLGSPLPGGLYWSF